MCLFLRIGRFLMFMNLFRVRYRVVFGIRWCGVRICWGYVNVEVGKI